jgi:hypothetical protein
MPGYIYSPLAGSTYTVILQPAITEYVSVIFISWQKDLALSSIIGTHTTPCQTAEVSGFLKYWHPD